jgi:hypothetical protein
MSGEPVLQYVIKRLADALRPIQHTSTKLGQTFSMTDRVHVGRSQISQKTHSVPCITVTEAPEQDIASTAQAGAIGLFNKLYYVSGFAPRNLEAEIETEEAYLLQATVLQQLGRALQIDNNSGAPTYPTEFMLGMPDRITSIETTLPLVISPERAVIDGACFYLPVLVTIAIDPFQPFMP